MALTGLVGVTPVLLADDNFDDNFDTIEAPAEAPANLPGWFFERRIVGDNNLEKIEAANSTGYYDMAKPIAIVKDSTDQGFCTGWRVAEDLFMTNYHCYEFAGCDVIFELDYETALDTEKHPRFKCEQVLNQNEQFDYALYQVSRLDDVKGSKSKRLRAEGGVIPLWAGSIKVGQPLVVAGHPQARTKEIDRSKDCKMKTIETEELGGRTTIRHTCDTEGGSSGSPVMDRKTGYAVALHWGGEVGFNMAIPMSLIIQDLEETIDSETFAKLTIKGRK